MSQRLELAMAAGTVVVKNRGHVEVNVTLVHLVPGPSGKPIHKRQVVTLKPNREVNLTRRFTVKELRASYAYRTGLKKVVGRRPIEVVQTW